MGLESFNYLNSLVATNPVSTDDVSQGDDHIRGIKSSLLATFPALTGAVTPTQDELNKLDGVVGDLLYTGGASQVLSKAIHLSFYQAGISNAWVFDFAQYNAGVFRATAAGAITIAFQNCAIGRWAIFVSQNATGTERDVVPTGDNGFSAMQSFQLTTTGVAPSYTVHLVLCLPTNVLYCISLA